MIGPKTREQLCQDFLQANFPDCPMFETAEETLRGILPLAQWNALFPEDAPKTATQVAAPAVPAANAPSLAAKTPPTYPQRFTQAAWKVAMTNIAPGFQSKHALYHHVVKPFVTQFIPKEKLETHTSILVAHVKSHLQQIDPAREYPDDKIKNMALSLLNMYLMNQFFSYLSFLDPSAFAKEMINASTEKFGFLGYLVLPMIIATLENRQALLQYADEVFGIEHGKEPSIFSMLFTAAHEFCTLMNGHDFDAIDEIYRQNPQLETSWLFGRHKAEQANDSHTATAEAAARATCLPRRI